MAYGKEGVGDWDRGVSDRCLAFPIFVGIFLLVMKVSENYNHWFRMLNSPFPDLPPYHASPNNRPNHQTHYSLPYPHSRSQTGGRGCA